jgi:proteasome lid subunit RPN8/RPN11
MCAPLNLIDRSKSMFRISKSQYRELLGKACRLARRSSGREICGLLLDTGCFLSLVETSNASKRGGSFLLRGKEIRRVSAAAQTLRQEVVGTFHSHPISEARPGPRDISSADDGSLMFIFDCIGRNGRLWRIRRRRAREVRWDFLDGHKT